MPKVLIKRGTRAQLNTAASASGLLAGELYLVTDENRLAVGLTTSTYGEVVDITGVQTLSGKRINPRTSSAASSATPTPNADTDDFYVLTALAAGATFGAPTGTPVDNQPIVIRIKDDGTARSLSWNAAYIASTDLALPTTTALGKTLYLGFRWNAAASKWVLLAKLDNV